MVIFSSLPLARPVFVSIATLSLKITVYFETFVEQKDAKSTTNNDIVTIKIAAAATILLVLLGVKCLLITDIFNSTLSYHGYHFLFPLDI